MDRFDFGEPDLTRAFPEGLVSSVRTVLDALPRGSSTQLWSPGYTGTVTLHGRPLQIPATVDAIRG